MKASRWSDEDDEPVLKPETKRPKIEICSKLPKRCRNVGDAYQKIKKLGEGTYGVVFQGKDKSTGVVVALKQVKIDKEPYQKQGFPVTALREINILLSLKHPNIVNCSEMVIDDVEEEHFLPYRAFMVMELFDHDIRSIIDGFPSSHGFSQGQIKCIVKQVLEGVKYMHNNWVLHRDLKTANLLYNNNGRVCICDFGMSRKFDSPIRSYTQDVVTLHYRAPEILFGSDTYDSASDMWSVGCVLAELLLKRTLFHGEGERQHLNSVIELLGPPDETLFSRLSHFKSLQWSKTVSVIPGGIRCMIPSSTVSSGGGFLTLTGMDLLSRMLCWDPTLRISAAESLDHPWFSEDFPPPLEVSEMPKFDLVTRQMIF